MQLLKITTTPIKYEYRVEKAKLEIKQEQPKFNITKTPSNLEMESKNIKMRLDTYEMRKSMNLKDTKTSIKEAAQEGKAAALEATAEYAQMGNQMTQAYNGVTIPDILAQKLYEQPTTITKFIPSVAPDVSWEENSLDMQYNPVKQDIKWDVNTDSIKEYIPGNFSLTIEQYPSIQVEYLGGPNYVPPSSDPNHKQVQ